MNKKTLEQVAAINRECFTSDDYYSSVSNLEYVVAQGGKFILVNNIFGELAGYIIYHEFKTHIESLRRALTAKERGKGQGVKLTKKLIAVANKKGKSIYTYVAKTNLPSLNSNIKCGYRVENIDANFVYIRYKAKK